MGRFLLAIIAVALAISASGAASLVVPEPCSSYQHSGGDDEGTCPPTCATCGCCAQPVEPPVAAVADSFRPPAALLVSTPGLPPQADPGDILHVPKTRLA